MIHDTQTCGCQMCKWVEFQPPIPEAQCDRCKDWVPQDTVKNRAGVTFCASCQEAFLDWVAEQANLQSAIRRYGEMG